MLFLAVTGRGEGTARRQVLRRASALPAGPRRSPTSTWTSQPVGTHDRRGRSASATPRSMTCSIRGDHGRPHLVADPEPEKGFYYRSDHFEFAKQGVPALYLDEASSTSASRRLGIKKRDEYTRTTTTSRRTRSSPTGTCPARWRTRGCCSRSATGSRRRRRGRSGSRARSSRRGERRCFRRSSSTTVARHDGQALTACPLRRLWANRCFPVDLIDRIGFSRPPAAVLTTPSASSSDRGQSCFSRRDIARSASSRPPVWQRAQ